MTHPRRPDGFFSSDPEVDALYRMMESVTDILGRMTVTIIMLIIVIATLVVLVLT